MDDAFLPGESVDLRATHESDLATLRKAGNDPRVWKTLQEFYPSTPEDEREYVREARENDERVLFTIAVDTRPVGRVDLRGVSDRTGEVTVSYFVVPEHMGRGYGTEAVHLAARYAFDHLRIHRITSYTLEHDRASERVLEKNGFQREGTKRDGAFVNGEYWDIGVWGLLADEWRDRDEEFRDPMEKRAGPTPAHEAGDGDEADR